MHNCFAIEMSKLLKYREERAGPYLSAVEIWLRHFALKHGYRPHDVFLKEIVGLAGNLSPLDLRKKGDRNRAKEITCGVLRKLEEEGYYFENH